MGLATYGYIWVGTLVYSIGEGPSLFLSQLHFELLDLVLEGGHLVHTNVFVLITPLVHLIPHGVLVVTEEVDHVLVRIFGPLLLRADR